MYGSNALGSQVLLGTLSPF